MALYRRIFPTGRDKKGRWFRPYRSHKKDYNFSSPEVLASYKSWQAPEFDQEQIRLIVFIKCDQKERKLLFDSKAIKKNEEKAEPSPAKGNPCKFGRRFGVNASGKNSPMETRQSENTGSPNPTGDPANKYTCLRPSSDIILLGEMMYGSVAMAYRGSTIKVHTIKSPLKLMLSQVFVLRPKENLDQDSISLAPVELMVPQRTDCPARESIAHSLPVAVPPSSPYNSIDEDSGVVSGSSSSFLTPFPSPGSSVSSNQSNSFHRRWMRNQVTSMEHGVRRKSSLETLMVDEPMNRRRHPKIGLGVVISLPEEEDQGRSRHFQTFFFSHFMLFEGHFRRLSLAVEKALTYQRRTVVIPIIMDALDEFRSAVYSLYCAPRIQRPIWLNMMTYQMQRGHLCEHLMHELVVELESHNSKQTNFFFSRLLTAVLMYHLAWVPTVVPAEATPSRAYLDKHSSTLLDMLAKSHPYNPLWAQLGDMFGAIGYPVKVAKTIVVGRRADVVCRLLYILSYFIRCSEVHEIPEHREKIYMEYEDTWELEKIDPIREKTEEGVDDAVPRTEGVLCSDSADSGLESSFDSGGRTDSQAFPRTEAGTEKFKQTANADENSPTDDLKLVRTIEESTSERGEQDAKADSNGNAVSAERCDSPSEALSDRPWSGTDPGSKVVGLGVSGHEATRSLSTGNLADTLPIEPVGRINRSASGGLYPDLQKILSGTADETDIGICISKSPQTEVRKPLPAVLLNNMDVIVPKQESVVAVGIVAPTENQRTTGVASIKLKTFDEASLDSKRERVVAVGRSVQIENQAGLISEHTCPNPAGKTNPEGLAKHKSRPGHERSSPTKSPELLPEDDTAGQLSFSESQESTTTKMQAPTSLNLYPTIDLGSVSIDATPVPSTDNTDTESLDGTPPVPRRNKRFPLTSPLARAYQESVMAKELKIEKSSDDSSANELDAKTPTNEDFSGTRWPQTASAENQLYSKDNSESDSTRPAVAHRPTPPLRLQIGEALCDGGMDSTGQQTTPVWSPTRKYHRCFSYGSTTSSGYSDMTLTDHEELPIAFSEPVTPDTDPGESYVDNFGRSLLGGYSQTYVPDMALHGVPELDRKKVLANLDQASQHSVLDGEIAEAVCIVADTDTWTVELLSSKRTSQSPDRPLSAEISAANCVGDLLESVQNMCNLRMPSDFCLMHLEDQLQEVYFKSTALASYLDQNPRTRPKELACVLGLDSSDLPLLLSVVSVHSPNVIRSAARESYEMRQESGKGKLSDSSL
ncbi:LOW QUALITY PROTEIN: folliculin-interacting protein 2-like [Patiria miniata]|uniref:UDENN FNIP1/2-type domain-containing protein n=1 Tax=Patiria miniata TaxID=46514 RepID=A0A914A9I8_PATMI|nr:LOW QUALITY PROTEIN: folliculin-interacting protein 2-like [Patiria miniata]